MDILNNLKNTLKVNTCTFAKKFASASILLLMLIIFPNKVSAVNLSNLVGMIYNPYSTDTNRCFYDTNTGCINNTGMNGGGYSLGFSNYNSDNVILEVGLFSINNSGPDINLTNNDTYIHYILEFTSNYDYEPVLDKQYIDYMVVTTNRDVIEVKKEYFNVSYKDKVLTFDLYLSYKCKEGTSSYNYGGYSTYGTTNLIFSHKGDSKVLSHNHFLANYSTGGKQRTFKNTKAFYEIVTKDSVPVVSSSEGGDNKVSNTILLSISIGVFCIFLYLVIRELFRR